MSETRNLRKDSVVYLIGHYTSQIVGNKLPSNKQVLHVLFFNMREVKLSLRESAALTIKEASIFWDKARIPIRKENHCVEKLEKLYAEWRALQKSAKRKSESAKQKEQIFVEKMDDLFDISHANALELITIEEDKQFLISQKQKGRPGCMYGIDYQLAAREKVAEEKHKKMSKRLQRSLQEKSQLMETVTLSSSGSSSSVEIESKTEGRLESQEEVPLALEEPGPSQPKKRKFYGTINIVTPKIVAAFDACRISDRYGVHILTAVAEALGHDVSSLSISRTTLQRSRQRMRKERAEKLKVSFKESDLLAPIIHWDGKLLPSLTGMKNVDRLAVLVTSGEVEQLLGVPPLEHSTGKEQALAVYETLIDWNLENRIIGLCCDTTASNVGYLNGAASILQQQLERDILYFPCRHHIFEIVLRSVFDVKMPSSSGPDVALFKRFKEYWPKIDQTNFKTGFQVEIIKQILQPRKSEIVDFINSFLAIQHPRDDYKEFLLLSKLFFEEQPSNVTFYRPGAFHHARWMSKAIYCLKIFFFQDQFKVTKKEKSAINDICLFLVNIYIKAWFTAPSAKKAPFHDLQFCKELIKYKNIDDSISKAACGKIKNHLWYLNPENVSLSFFDENILIDVKKEMVRALNRPASHEESIKRVIVGELDEIENKEIYDFICVTSKNFFQKMNFPTEFLGSDPATWNKNESYSKCCKIINNLKVVNDTAERGIKLINEYNKILTKDEEQKQFLLQVVKDYKTRFPDVKKETMLQVLE